MTTRRRRGLSSEDVELWTFVTRDVEPLKRRRRKAAAKPPAEATPQPDQPSAPSSSDPAKAAAGAISEPALPAKPRSAKTNAKTSTKVTPKITPKAKAPALPPIAPIDRKERRQVVRGTRAIDARIDLHGMRQAEAHGALRGFLAIGQMRGYGMVLVITGKGGGDESFVSLPDERGVLRRVVPQWLRMPDLRPLVLGFEEAHQGHGGAGALYVRLRRLRKSGPP